MNPTFDLLRLRLAQSPLFPWWAQVGEAVRALLPSRLARMLDARERWLGLRPQGDELHVLSHVDRRERELGALPLHDGEALAALQARLDTVSAPRWLLLDGRLALRRELSLPLAAEVRLREMLLHEIDRQTPFAAGQVAYEGRVLARDPASRQMKVELLVLPIQAMDAGLRALGPLAAGLTGVDLLDAQGRRLGLNLLPATERQRRADPTRRIHATLAGLALLFLFSALLITLDNRRAGLEALRARVEAANVEVRQARALRNQLQASAAQANFLAQTRAAQPTMLELLNDLTRRIPDDTSLDKLAVNERRLVLVGQSRAAPALVGLLQASPLLTSPALAGAVQADPRGGRGDRFTLTATVGGGNREAGDGQRR